MKKRWENPFIEIQEFTANEYVSTCYDGSNATITLTCTDNGLLFHQICHNPATISYTTWTGKENNNGSRWVSAGDIINVKINGADIDPDHDIANGTYNATWQAYNDGSTYNHSGTAKVTGVVTQADRPLHS